MAYIAPNTTVQFLNVPFDTDYENTMYFASLAAQGVYMDSKVISGLTVGSNSYQRKGRGVIRVGWVADTTSGNSVIKNLYNANYMRYKNTNYENKWFYAFVTHVEYINNNTCDVFFSIDVMQTYLFDYTMLECFIERQHTVTDDVGEHTVPEGIEHGEYMCEPVTSTLTTNGLFDYAPTVCLVTTFDDQGDYSPGQRINGQEGRGDMFSGLTYRFYDLTTGLTQLNDDLEALSGARVLEDADTRTKIPQFLSDGVVALFMVPGYFASAYGSTVASKKIYLDIRDNGSYKLGTYRPRNKKLMCYPYNFLYATNNQGNSAEYRWEDFASPINATLEVWGNLSPNGGMVCTPVGYKKSGGNVRNVDEMIQVTGFPLCSWTYDAFKAWCAQNAGTLGAAAVGIVGKWAEIVMTGGAGALIGSQSNPMPFSQQGAHQQFQGEAPYNPSVGTSGLSGALAGTLAAVGQLYDHARRPPQAKGNGNTSLAYQAGVLTFGFFKKYIKQEYAEIIDAYLDMYGYKVNMVGVPNRHARPCWTYVKTVGCAIDGLLPADDAQKIQAIYNNGIRFWDSSATFGVYSPLVNNNEVTVVG